MDYIIHRYRFRLDYRGQTSDVLGRCIERPDGHFNLQVWLRDAQQPSIMLEVQFCPNEDDVWPLFWKVCAHRGVRPMGVQRQKADGGFTDWKPVPGMPAGA